MLDTPRGDLSNSFSVRLPALTEETGEKQGHKEKKARKRAEMARNLASLGADLARLDVALRHLDDRVGDLHGVQVAQEEAVAAAAARAEGAAEGVERVSAEAAAARTREEGLRAAMAELSGAVDRLRAEAAVITDSLADIAAQPDRDTALFVIEDRIEAAEAVIAGLQSGLKAARPDPGIGEELKAVTADLASVRDGLRQGLQEQGARLAEVEQRFGQEIEALKQAMPDQERLDDAQRTLRAELDARIEDLAAEVSSRQEQARYALEQTRRRAEHGQQANKRGMVVGLGVLGLLALALAGGNWWRTDLRFDRVSGQIADTAAARQVPETTPALPVAGAGPDSAIGRLTQTLGKAQAHNDRLADKLITLQKDQAAARADAYQARVQRIEQAQAKLAQSAQETAELLASLRARLNGLAKPQPALDAAPGTAPLVLEEPRYVVQLIGFHQEPSVAEFAQEFGMTGKARYMPSWYRGKRWYVVLTGDYASAEEGFAAARKLPPRLKALKPWVRRLPAGSQLLPIR
jgi:hypothetical protein